MLDIWFWYYPNIRVLSLYMVIGFQHHPDVVLLLELSRYIFIMFFGELLNIFCFKLRNTDVWNIIRDISDRYCLDIGVILDYNICNIRYKLSIHKIMKPYIYILPSFWCVCFVVLFLINYFCNSLGKLVII